MRSTRATAAVERLKQRSGNPQYSMARTAEGLFYLLLGPASEASSQVSELLEMDDFVAFVNAQGPQRPKRISKLDVAFEKQLAKKAS